MKKAFRILLSIIIFVVLGIAFYVTCILFIFGNPIGQFKNAREADKMAKLQYFLDKKMIYILL